MEIEAKFAIVGELDVEAISALDLQPYSLRPCGEQRQHDVILDTADRAISGAGRSLRVRQVGDAAVLTLKGPGRVVGGIHEREELELPISAAEKLKRRHWPREIADPVRELAGGEKLQPLLELDVLRRIWEVWRDGREVGELVLDHGTIHADGRSEALREIELELKGEGARDDLEQLAARLQELLPLRPEPRTKLQRGLALLDQTSAISGRTPLPDAARSVISRFVLKLQKSEPIAREGSDPEGVHDMRVATRRLRTTLRLLEESPAFDQQALSKLRRRLRRLARVLGGVRDLDVLLEHVHGYRAARPEQDEGLDGLAAEIERRRERAREQLLEELDSGRMRRLMARLLELSAGLPLQAAGGEPRAVLVRHFAGSTLWRHYEQVLRYETVIGSAPPEVLHNLRIEGKQLRYALELFQEPLGEETASLLKTLMALQEQLGLMQDQATAQALIEELGSGGAGVEAYLAARAAESRQLRDTLGPLWAHLSGLPFRKRLAALIARL